MDLVLGGRGGGGGGSGGTKVRRLTFLRLSEMVLKLCKFPICAKIQFPGDSVISLNFTFSVKKNISPMAVCAT